MTDAPAVPPAAAAVDDRRPAVTSVPTRLDASIVGAVIVVASAAALVLGRTWAVNDLIPILVGGAGLCLALLARRFAPGAAWVALIVSSLVAAGVPIGLSRAADPGAIGVGAWLGMAIPASAAAVVTVLIAASYATRPDRRLAPGVGPVAAFAVAWLVVACVVVVVLVMAGSRADPAFTVVDVATAPTALFLHFVLFLAALGLAADLRAAMRRAETRPVHLGTAAPSERRPIGDRARAILRELIPGQADADAATVEAERIRLAGDLHASVLPALRRAIADAESGLPIENLAQRLKTVDLELERLMADRWPVVLDAFGLIAALEDLAERTEGESPIQVVLEIGRVTGRPLPEIERAAWRVAQLAVDNAVRHAVASEVTVAVAVAPDHVVLSIADDGRGFDRANPVRPGARGVADLERRSANVGASLAIEAGSVSGTVVRFEWPAVRPAQGNRPGGPRRA